MQMQMQENQEDLYQQEPGGIFFPEIDQILWRKNDAPPESAQPAFKYLVKYKDYSYLHCEWLDEKEVVADTKSGRNKLNRFNKMFEKKLREGVPILFIWVFGGIGGIRGSR